MKNTGRSTRDNPPNRFQAIRAEPLLIHLDTQGGGTPTQFFRDSSKTILAKNDSPDIPYTFSLNPYRGCEHGCIYCYARPTHEYLGFSAGLDFETKIMVKEDAPELLQAEFRKKRWKPQMICLSGNTDCYQPVERKLEITRRCLEVFLRFRNPVGIVTKNELITRDIDILRKLATDRLAAAAISITTLDADLAREMEPRTSTPERRLETVRALSAAGIPVTVNVAPVIPGLNDEEIPALLREAAGHGATAASYTFLRLPGAVEELFLGWLARNMPGRSAKIIGRIQDVRGGKMHEGRFGTRMKGEGEFAASIRQLFSLSCRKYDLAQDHYAFDLTKFGTAPPHQADLFG